MVVALEWLKEACDNNIEFSDSRQKLRALLSTTSRKTHRIAYILRDVLSMKKINSEYTEYFEAMRLYAESSLHNL
jgi:hypothetical protein